MPPGTPAAPTGLIVDDEALLRAQLRWQLAEVWPELQIVGEAANGEDAVRIYDTHPRAEWPAVCFLDIQMPVMNGVDAARRIGRRAHLVFVTAYDRYAVEAFERGAIDYLLKPADDARLAETVRRLKEKLDSPVPGAPPDIDAIAERLARAVSAPPATRHLQWIRAAIGSTVRLIPVDEVLYFQSDSKYTRVVTAHEEVLIRTTIRELLDGLDPEAFWQIHRATIVNLRAIAGVVRGLRDSADLRLKGRPEKLVVSRAFVHRFRQM
jgi:DNA-binding LytR/AlgR family response regulator